MIENQIAISPLFFEFQSDKGEKIEGFLQILNSSPDRIFDINMESEEIFPKGEDGRISFKKVEDDLSLLYLSSWIKFEPENFSLLPREEKRIKFYFSIPEDAEPRGYYASLIVNSRDINISEKQISIFPRIASLIFLKVFGDVEENLSVVDFKFSKKYYEKGLINFEILFKNEGTVHLKPKAKISITNILGKEVAEIFVDEKIVLPNSLRRITGEWKEKLLFGIRYKATLSGFYGEKDLLINPVSVYFWAFPLRLTITLLILLIFFLLIRKRLFTVFKILILGEKGIKKKEK